MKLSMKRETFCQILTTQSCNPTEAYRKAFNVSSDRKATHTEAASRLMKDSNVVARIEALKLDISDKLASEVAWTKARIVSELSINVDLGRETKQLAASNQALNLIGKAVGSVFEPDSVAVTGSVSVIHGLSNEVLDQLAASCLVSLPKSTLIPNSETILALSQTTSEANFSLIPSLKASILAITLLSFINLEAASVWVAFLSLDTLKAFL